MEVKKINYKGLEIWKIRWFDINNMKYKFYYTIEEPIENTVLYISAQEASMNLQ